MANLKPPSTTYLPTHQTYALWAPTYDTDGNFLQALDSLILPALLSAITPHLPPNPAILDLGCGTGRTTLALLEIPGVELLGVDNCIEMLEIAERRLGERWRELTESKEKAKGWEVGVWNICDRVVGERGEREEEEEGNEKMEKGNGNEDYQDEKDKEKTYRKGIQKMSLPASHFSLLTSTLVLEHIPLLPRFLHTCSSLLRVGGFLLITNMHEDMGKAGSQAGFTNPDTGEKVRGDSYFHRVEDVVEEAGRCGLEVHWGPEEREVMPAQVGMLGRRAERWVGVRVWWGVVLRKKVNS